MKKYKYLGFFIVLAIIFSANAAGKIARAESDDGEYSDDAPRITAPIRVPAKTKLNNLGAVAKKETNPAKAIIDNSIIAGRQNVLDKFDGVVEKITNLENKINTLIEKISLKGADVADAKNFMQTADTAVADAETKISAVNDIFSVSINQLTAEQKDNLKTLTEDIQTDVNNASAALNSAVQSLKDSLVSQK